MKKSKETSERSKSLQQLNSGNSEGEHYRSEDDVSEVDETGDEEEETSRKYDEEESEFESEDEDEVYKVRVLSDFVGEYKDDLDIKEGDILTIKERREDGWWLAEDAHGNIGVVPKTLVERIRSKTQSKKTGESELEKADVSSSPNKTDKKDSRSGTELWQIMKDGNADKKTSVTNVLKAMGAMPAGFRQPTLGKLVKQEDYGIGSWVYPKLTQSHLAFRDLHWDPVESKLRNFPVRISRFCSIVSAKMVPKVGTGVDVISRQIHVALWDSKQVLSNVHTIKTVTAEKDLMHWNVIKNPRLSSFDGDILVRSNSELANIGILFELTVSFVRQKTGEESEVSCGWCVLKLFQETGAPTENNNFELLLNGGTPYDHGVQLEPSANARVGGLMQSLIKANRQPRLTVKLAPITKPKKDMCDLLPETLVAPMQYTPLIAQYRELLADEFVQNIDCINQTDLVSDPVLSTFPKAVSQFDLMDALKVSWDDGSKKSIRQSMRHRDRQERKKFFRTIYMNTVFPLLKLINLPSLASRQSSYEQERGKFIQDFLSRRDAVSELLSDKFNYKPFNLNRMSFDVLSRHCVTRETSID
ncbi:nephrocystin-1-like isoform X2 [Xenia sp. Carnegie-2017]|uniref:nephrocystin-1-like isoform X2 n=1 Tax=Xenia sp. Carnegie-2017 TaxID=2897299 RepID=UPI001F03BA97|nr:nephrocystin-1-like isoform X2 [Xenia sp. Carnegie-2017]XP_046839268.1 nephrocystin-1-like isoform X2 [Xenia sp. Carnegie-2017]XP_046839269.1 nephrocystin-1-like isoform X2 [Xenia sp. Carnegie-2017]